MSFLGPCGGVSRGADATCACVCAVARPFMYGLAIAGQQGVEDVLRGLLADTEVTLGLAGYKSVAEIHGKKDEVLMNLAWL